MVKGLPQMPKLHVLREVGNIQTRLQIKRNEDNMIHSSNTIPSRSSNGNLATEKSERIAEHYPIISLHPQNQAPETPVQVGFVHMLEQYI